MRLAFERLEPLLRRPLSRRGSQADHAPGHRVRFHGMPCSGAAMAIDGAILATLTGAALAITLAWHVYSVRARDAAVGELAAFARALADGFVSPRPAVLPASGLAPLAQALGHVADRLSDRAVQMARSESQMATVFANIADGLVVTDVSGRVQLLNPAAEAIFGLSSAQALGRTLLDLTLSDEVNQLVLKALRSRRPRSDDLVVRFPREQALSIYCTPIQGSGPIQGAVAVFQDTTRARKLDAVRRDFITNASHEMKTPVAAIKMMAETLQAGASQDPEVAGPFLEMLLGETRRLEALLRDLLDLSVIESGQGLGSPEEVALKSVADGVARKLAVEAVRKRQDLRLTVPDSLRLRTDPRALEQILTNLVDNAIKYTPSGGTITVSADREADWVRVHVADTGPGIPRQDLDRVFERFYRVDKAHSREVGGTGLGLSIVKHLAEALGGRVSVASPLGQGSTFTVELPGGRPETPE